MHLSVAIRYLERSATHFPQGYKLRNLCLDTNTLSPATKAAVEFLASLPNYGGREILRFRHLFVEEQFESFFSDDWKTFVIENYVEDEHEQEVSPEELSLLITGDSNSILITGDAPDHEVQYALSADVPAPYSEVIISDIKKRQLGYFSRDLKELLSTRLINEGPGSFHFSGGPESVQHRTAVTGEQLRAHLMIFRRLYMTNEDAGLAKASATFQSLISGHPLSLLAKGRLKTYHKHLSEPPRKYPHSSSMPIEFTTKQLIDSVMYTKYLHQPKPEVERQYQDCLAQTGGNEVYLHGMFVCELYLLSVDMRNAGLIIASWFENWCNLHHTESSVIGTADHPGIGAVETKEQMRNRLFLEKVTELATLLWEQAGRPQSGVLAFSAAAKEQLSIELNSSNR